MLPDSSRIVLPLKAIIMTEDSNKELLSMHDECEAKVHKIKAIMAIRCCNVSALVNDYRKKRLQREQNELEKIKNEIIKRNLCKQNTTCTGQ